MTDWNKTLLESKVLKKINDDISITYQVPPPYFPTESLYYLDGLIHHHIVTLLQQHKVTLSSQVTSDGGGGMVSSRDFVYCAKVGFKGDVFVMGGCSVDYKEAPSSSKIVRYIGKSVKASVIKSVCSEQSTVRVARWLHQWQPIPMPPPSYGWWMWTTRAGCLRLKLFIVGDPDFWPIINVTTCTKDLSNFEDYQHPLRLNNV